MDILFEKLDGSRYYLSQYKVLITEFEESAPSVTRNNMQLDQRNGNIDFGGWHKDKTINITGYYRADDIDEEEMLREKLYALLSDPDGYYITQLKTSPEASVERPGETSGNYYDKLKDYPSHKRFLVYTEAPEMELVGNVNGTLLYKLTAKFKTLRLPYGETPAIDIDIDNTPYKDLPMNMLIDSGFESGKTPSGIVWGTSGDDKRVAAVETETPSFPTPFGKYMLRIENQSSDSTISSDQYIVFPLPTPVTIKAGETWTYSYRYATAGSAIGQASNYLTTNDLSPIFDLSMGHGNRDTDGGQATWHQFSATMTAASDVTVTHYRFGFVKTYAGGGWLCIDNIKLEKNATASPWSPNPADPEYYTQGISIPYSGTVPCSQLEQGFTVQITATGSASSLSFKIDDTELTSSNAVAAGDVILLNGFSYTQNGLSIVSKTNKAYFILQPDKPNRITYNVPGNVKILGFQNLYA